MGERKVLNKYYPPDFDPSKLPRAKRTQTNDMKVRMMLPMSVRCKTCGTFMQKGTKFNTCKEDVLGEDYLGIQVGRLYYRCKKCSAEFCMKTDPKNADYILEQGATRNYEPWRDEEATKAKVIQKREQEEMGNAMKALENRTLDSKREMDIMAALDEMKALKAQHARVTTEQALAALQAAAQQQQPDEDDAEELFQLRARAVTKRLSDSEEDDNGPAAEAAAAGRLAGLDEVQGAAGGQGQHGAGSRPAAKPAVKVIVKPKPKAAEAAAGGSGQQGTAGAAGGKRLAEAEGGEVAADKKARVEGEAGGSGGALGLGLLGAYASSSDSEASG